MNLKPYLMKYPCPHCKMGLQSEHTESGKTQTCPGCQKQFIAPPAPPRPIGGWLAVYAVILILACCSIGLVVLMVLGMAFLTGPVWGLAAASVMLLAMLPAIVLTYGFFKQRKWFVPCQMFSLVASIPIYFISLVIEQSTKPDDFIWLKTILTVVFSCGLLLYFWRSQRVKETFTT